MLSLIYFLNQLTPLYTAREHNRKLAPSNVYNLYSGRIGGLLKKETKWRKEIH